MLFFLFAQAHVTFSHSTRRTVSLTPARQYQWAEFQSSKHTVSMTLYVNAHTRTRHRRRQSEPVLFKAILREGRKILKKDNV